jgi:hypothetical protein
MGLDFKNRLKDALRPAPIGAECTDCRQVFDLENLYEGLCERCSLEEAYWYTEDPREEWTYVRDQAL